MCSNKKFQDNETSHCKYLTVNELNGRLDPKDILIRLGEMGITSLILEGGSSLIDSFLTSTLALPSIRKPSPRSRKLLLCTIPSAIVIEAVRLSKTVVPSLGIGSGHLHSMIFSIVCNMALASRPETTPFLTSIELSPFRVVSSSLPELPIVLISITVKD